MRFPLLAAGAAVLQAGVMPAVAQTTPSPAAASPARTGAPTLSIDDAIALARRNNPDFQSRVDQRRSASAAVRAATGSLLPSLSTDFGSSYREGRQQFFAGQSFGAQSDQISSSVGVSVGAQYDRATFLNPKIQRANAAAVEADIGGAEQNLRTTVTQQYFTVLQRQATAQLQDSLVATAQATLDLAKARVAVGAATILDVRRAEVGFGQQRVAVVQARNQAAIESLRLFQQIGVDQPADVQLTTRYPITDAPLPLPDLLGQARRANPTLDALRTREDVAGLTVKSAHGGYLPTLSLQAGLSGFTNQYTNSDVLVEQATGQARSSCLTQVSVKQIIGVPADASICNAIGITPAQASQIRATNRTYPFDFTRNPYSVGATLSFPIFNGFSREQRIQEALVQRNAAQYNVRAQELRLTADVTGAYLTLQASKQTVALQEQVASTAREALALAQERYRVGANTFLEVSQARDEYAKAQTDLINAVYDYHRSFAALENAVGRPLR